MLRVLWEDRQRAMTTPTHSASAQNGRGTRTPLVEMPPPSDMDVQLVNVVRVTELDPWYTSSPPGTAGAPPASNNRIDRCAA